ncbi:MAG: SDR family oxidoreductase [Firmicutes bacterium]|nr:SDR family oxidoreductase [Bacillota bacterium]
MRFTGKTAVVTGAASGIGRAAAELLIQEGAFVFLVDWNTETLNEIVRAFETCRKGSCQPIAGDVGKLEIVERLHSAISGPVHVLINAAGTGAFDKSIERTEEDEWDRILATNLKSIYLVSRALLPNLREGAPSVILNMASPHAYATGPGLAPYAASKGGVVALSRQMAFDLASDNIRVNAIIPGAVDTPMLRAHGIEQNMSLEELGFYDDPRKLGRIASPVEFARALVLFAMDDASFINASPIFIDGGLLARL